jgi:hypothetical protein
MWLCDSYVGCTRKDRLKEQVGGRKSNWETANTDVFGKHQKTEGGFDCYLKAWRKKAH